MADDYSVFELAGAPLSVLLFADVDATSTTIEVPGFGLPADASPYDYLGSPTHVQVGSEWMRVTSFSAATGRLTTHVIQDIGVGDDTVTVLTSSPLRANPAVGVADPVTIDGEAMTVTSILGPTSVRVTRASPVAHTFARPSLSITLDTVTRSTRLTAPVAVGDTAIKVADSSVFSGADVGRAADVRSFAAPDPAVGGAVKEFLEVVTFAGIVDATTVNVTRSATPLAHLASQRAEPVSYTNNTRRTFNVTRGVLGTQATPHAQWEPVFRLYQPSDFVAARSLDFHRFYLYARYPNGTIATIGLATVTMAFWESQLGSAHFFVVGPLDVGAEVYVTGGGLSYGYTDFYVTKVAGATGAPIVPSATLDWYAVSAGPNTGRSVLTSSDAATVDVRRSAANRIEILTAGHYTFEVSIANLI